MVQYKPKCIDENNVHQPHYFVKLYEMVLTSTGKEIAFSWCSECGAAAVDDQYDGRFAGRIVELQHSNLERKVRELAAKEEQEKK